MSLSQKDCKPVREGSHDCDQYSSWSGSYCSSTLCPSSSNLISAWDQVLTLLLKFPIWTLLLVLIVVCSIAHSWLQVGNLIFSWPHPCHLKFNSEVQTPCLRAGFLFPWISWQVIIACLLTTSQYIALLQDPVFCALSASYVIFTVAPQADQVTCQFLSR